MSENNPIPSVLSKEMLLEIGGWRAMQEGRSLWEAGKVMSVDWIDPVLGGVVQAGTGTVNARLKLGGPLVPHTAIAPGSRRSRYFARTALPGRK